MKEKYWKVSHNADLAETGYCTNLTYIKTIWQGFPAQQMLEHIILEDFCFKRFGSKAAYVQGTAVCQNWKVEKSNKNEFDEARPIIWGGYPTETVIIELGIGDHEKIIILSEQ